jgi:hypothetical protein
MIEKLEKSYLQIVEANKEGLIEDSLLIKALSSFREKTNWEAPEDYELIKSKTFNEFIKGELPNQELMKSIQVGETKVVDGKTFVAKMTKSGVIDWRRVTTKKAKKVKSKNILDDFPKDFDDLEIVKGKSLGGSTGAVLVKDKNTDILYVMKKGSSPAHIEEEFLANQIYDTLGVIVPRVSLYNEGTNDAFMLSEYMENTVDLNNSFGFDDYKEEVVKNYVADCLLANWDVYKNDNILINKDDGLIYRVDNGGSLRFSATGRDKGDDFKDEVDELESMITNNLRMTNQLTQDDLQFQIKEVLKKEKAVLSLIKDKDLKQKMSNRFNDLKDRLDEEYDVSDPYRELSEKELEKALKKAGGSLWNSNDKVGWTFLSEVCKMRGFDKQPEVLENDEFDKLLENDDVKLLQRGLTGTSTKSSRALMKDFTSSDDCFYGRVGMYGAGIYAAVNFTKKNPPPPNKDYQIAFDYAGNDENSILDIALTSDAKVVDAKDLDEMMHEEFFGPEFKEKKKEYDDLNNEVSELLTKYANIEKIIEEDVRKEMNWNQDSLDELNSRLEVKYNDLEKFPFKDVAENFKKIVESIGGKFQKVTDNSFRVSLPFSQEVFDFTEFTTIRSFKQKNENLDVYNYHYQLMKNFIVKNHYKVINNKVKEEVKNSGKIEAIEQELKDKRSKLTNISNEISKLKTDGSSTMNQVLAKIAKNPGGEYRGFYAAIKGYDVIIQKNGWGGSTDFAVILNRSKMKVRKVN